jgi:NAD(P)-dependent dehydrogenase (short-subunit alcohol dehydrogenase family)
MTKKIAAITGVGSSVGTGAALAKRFSQGGYEVAMLARNAERLKKHEATIPNSHGFACDVTDESQVNRAISAVKEQLGAPSVLIHNAVGGKIGSFLEVDPEIMLQNFKVNAMGLLYLVRALAPDMVKAESGTIIATGNTSAFRGKPNFAAFAPTKAAQRILAESIARELNPKGIHVAYLMIDAVINVPWTRGLFPDKPDSFFIEPATVAEEVWHLAQQGRNGWSFNAEIRPFGEQW